MGEVYRARDTRLGRDVAVKVLPAASRVEPRGARALRARGEDGLAAQSSAHLRALRRRPRAASTDYLVMELIEGETLADALAQGRAAARRRLRIGVADRRRARPRAPRGHHPPRPEARQHHAHQVGRQAHGLRPRARRRRRPVRPGQRRCTTRCRRSADHARRSRRGHDHRHVPVHGARAARGQGGRRAQRHLGASARVLYEMATGTRAFDGTSQASLIAAIMHDEPAPISPIAPVTPAGARPRGAECLAKDPEERWQSAGDIRRELGWIGSVLRVNRAPAAAVAAARLAALAIAVAALLAPALRPRVPPSAASARGAADGAVDRPARAHRSRTTSSRCRPDGGTLAFAGIASGKSLLRLRELGSSDVRALPGTESAESPSGPPTGVRSASSRAESFRGSTSRQAPSRPSRTPRRGAGELVPRGEFPSRSKAAGAIYRVAAAGRAGHGRDDSQEGRLFTAGPSSCRTGKRFLFFVKTGRSETTGTYLAILGKAGPQARPAQRRDRRLRTARDAALRPERRPPRPALRSRYRRALRRSGDGRAAGDARGARLVPSTSSPSPRRGVLVYRAGIAERQLTWMDRKGNVLGKLGSPASLWSATLSPDDREAALPPHAQTGVYTSPPDRHRARRLDAALDDSAGDAGLDARRATWSIAPRGGSTRSGGEPPTAIRRTNPRASSTPSPPRTRSRRTAATCSTRAWAATSTSGSRTFRATPSPRYRASTRSSTSARRTSPRRALVRRTARTSPARPRSSCGVSHSPRSPGAFRPRRPATHLEPRRQEDLLCVARRPVHGGARSTAGTTPVIARPRRFFRAPQAEQRRESVRGLRGWPASCSRCRRRTSTRSRSGPPQLATDTMSLSAGTRRPLRDPRADRRRRDGRGLPRAEFRGSDARSRARRCVMVWPRGVPGLGDARFEKEASRRLRAEPIRRRLRSTTSEQGRHSLRLSSSCSTARPCAPGSRKGSLPALGPRSTGRSRSPGASPPRTRNGSCIAI